MSEREMFDAARTGHRCSSAKAEAILDLVVDIDILIHETNL